MKKVVVANNKGGVGKSTTSLNLSAGLAKAGKKVLLIDLDPQGHSTAGFKISTENNFTVAELLCEDKCTLEDVVQNTYIKNLDIIPSDASLAMAEIRLSSMRSKEHRLHIKMEKINHYDYVIVDTPPTHGNLLENAFSFGEHLIIPIQLLYFNFIGANNFLNIIEYFNRDVRQVTKREIRVLGVLFTLYKTKTKQSKRVVNGIHKLFGNKIFNTTIPENIRLSEAQEYGKSIFDYDPDCPGSLAYKNLTFEVMEKLECKI